MNGDRITKGLLFVSSLIILLLSAGIVLSLAGGAIPVFKEYGLGFITSTAWNPTSGSEEYGAMPFIAGTIITSILALIICIPMAFSTSLFIAEYYSGTRTAGILRSLVDLLAGIPSIVYGFWGFYALRPLLISTGLTDQGFGVFTASVVLAIMIVPYATSLSIEIISMVPAELKEAAYSLGATRREVIFSVVIPAARSGIVAELHPGTRQSPWRDNGRHNAYWKCQHDPEGTVRPGNTMASVIANQFGEADGLKMSALIAIGLILFVITALVNATGKFIIRRFA